MPALCPLSELHLPEIRKLLVGAACAGQFVWQLGTGGRLYRWDLPVLDAELKKLGLARH